MVHAEERSAGARSKTNKLCPGIRTVAIKACGACVVERERCIDSIPRWDPLLPVVFENVVVFVQLKFPAFILWKDGEGTRGRVVETCAEELAVD